MTDPLMTAALKEAYATATDEVILSAVEIAHPSIVDENGQLDSIWLTADENDYDGTLEAGAPVKGGQTVTWRAFPFRARLAPVDTSPAPDVELRIDGVDARIIRALRLIVASSIKLVMRYREYLESELPEPQRLEPQTFVLHDVEIVGLSIVARARVDADFNGAFPRFVYTAAEFPALVGA